MWNSRSLRLGTVSFELRLPTLQYVTLEADAKEEGAISKNEQDLAIVVDQPPLRRSRRTRVLAEKNGRLTPVDSSVVSVKFCVFYFSRFFTGKFRRIDVLAVRTLNYNKSANE